MRDGRWITVTKSEFPHEQGGLDDIRGRLPDNDPWGAWSNFTFTAVSGHPREVDLLVIAPGGVHLIELKDWSGSLDSHNGTWLQTRLGGQQEVHGNPLHLANKKAKELAGLLAQQGERVWVSEAVCFTNPSLRFRLPAHEQHGVHTVAKLAEMLKRPPRDERHRIDTLKARAIRRALERIGIKPSDAEFRVGPYQLARKSFDSGPTWADYLAQHTDLHEAVRIRVYLRERGSDAALRASVERTARREAAVLRGFQHSGVVQLKQYDPSGHSAGPALIFDYDPRTLRLDEYLTQYGKHLDILSRMALVRQLAETMRSAHGRRIYHRTLAARAVHVVPRGRGRTPGQDGEETGWLAPLLQISDWQVAAQRGSQHGAPGSTERSAPTSFAQAGAHLAEGSDPYLAPELTALKPDPVGLDVYGLGVLTYLLVTGQAPAASQAELLARYDAGEGLRPSAVVDGLSEFIDELVQAATAYQLKDRLSSVDDFLEMLEVVEDTLTEPAPATPSSTPASVAPVPTPAPVPASETHGSEPSPAETEKDPLEAVAGDLLAGRWEIRRRLGTGSTSRAFLARDVTAGPEVRFAKTLVVLKVATKDASNAVLEREAEVMERLRADSRIIRLVGPKRLRLKGRTVLVMEYVGDERQEDHAAGPVLVRRREETVARQLRQSGRLPVDQLEAYGDYLFGAVDFLEGEGVWHRDIKPDNIAIRIRPNRTRELVLIDFSLAGYQVQNTSAGTEDYLDPFIGELTERSVYDAHAERYAVAVTLHEMASRELPLWGGGRVSPRQTDPEQEPYPQIATDAFDPAVKDGLTEFFRRALHRDATRRFTDLKQMRDAWKRIFLDLDKVKPSSRRALPVSGGEGDGSAGQGAASARIAEAEDESTAQARDRLATTVTRDTAISASGLSPAAESFVHGLEITSVGELLDYTQRRLVNAPGLGPKTLKEVQGRIKEWRQRLAEQPAAPLTPEGRKAAQRELRELQGAPGSQASRELSGAEATIATAMAEAGATGGVSGQALRGISLDALATLFVPELKKDGGNRTDYEMVRLLLRLPDESGTLPAIGVWPQPKEVADTLGVPAGTLAPMLRSQRSRWRTLPAVKALRAEILELLNGLGRVASAAEIADALAVRRGTQLPEREQRRALALAAVRAVVETESAALEKAAFLHAVNRNAADAGLGAGLLALQAAADTAPGTPAGPALLGYAQQLGKVADRLAGLESLPTSSVVIAELSAVTPPNELVGWDERRMVEIAAAASRHAASTPRLEIYPRDLPLVRALRLTQAGLVRLIPGIPEDQQPGLTPEDVHDRLRARFPELLNDRGGYALPTGGTLTTALAEAGFDLVLSKRSGTRTWRYLPRFAQDMTSYLSTRAPGRRGSGAAPGAGRGSGSALSTHRYSDDPQEAAAVTAWQRLRASARRDGFRVLTVRTALLGQAELRLGDQGLGVRNVSVAGEFLGALREQVARRPKPTWETLMRADAAPPGSKAAMKFAEYARTAWSVTEPRLAELLAADGAPGPVLLTDAGGFARYDAMAVLERLAEQARSGGRGLWLLCPQNDPAAPPRLGITAVPYQAGLGEWIVLPDMWAQGEVTGESAGAGTGAGVDAGADGVGDRVGTTGDVTK
ncbi:BREX system serine/threonine kinase PglW [Streptomyces xiamenensis]|uniref:BREX system serine/threonine kinase PglW n=1 Tax=Streptomyces xiamenensis TaxID=408015 RepID=UPI0037D2A573